MAERVLAVMIAMAPCRGQAKVPCAQMGGRSGTLVAIYIIVPGQSRLWPPRADGLHATPTGPQGSHILTSMLGADALAIVPSERGDVRRGERVRLVALPGRTMPVAPADCPTRDGVPASAGEVAQAAR